MLLSAICGEVISRIRVEVTTQATSRISVFAGEAYTNYAIYTETKFKALIFVDVSVQPQREHQCSGAEVIGHAPPDTIDL